MSADTLLWREPARRIFMSVHLRQPYTIVASKIRRYSEHYQIPADRCLIVPVKLYGEEISCDVRWEDDNGELHYVTGLLFRAENLEKLNQFVNVKLYELWEHFYGVKQT